LETSARPPFFEGGRLTTGVQARPGAGGGLGLFPGAQGAAPPVSCRLASGKHKKKGSGASLLIPQFPRFPVVCTPRRYGGTPGPSPGAELTAASAIPGQVPGRGGSLNNLVGGTRLGLSRGIAGREDFPLAPNPNPPSTLPGFRGGGPSGQKPALIPPALVTRRGFIPTFNQPVLRSLAGLAPGPRGWGGSHAGGPFRGRRGRNR